ncbi:cuticle protein [Holotrichia oblita]|uniref:Cuticle protein n=2 Tax=Holotrichia oblita TaxID=644536 RepID=A0ACB9THI8_HOLOL|nr:cuticle protein [Holotrichia oblita]
MPSRSGVEPPCRAIAALPQTVATTGGYDYTIKKCVQRSYKRTQLSTPNHSCPDRKSYYNTINMKCVLVALVVVLAVASASVAPLAYSVASPVAYTGAYPYAYPYAAAYAAPYAAPLAYSVAAPVAVGGTGYVAATRGSVHTAPLPEGPFASSLHINTAPAPGTF